MSSAVEFAVSSVLAPDDEWHFESGDLSLDRNQSLCVFSLIFQHHHLARCLPSNTNGGLFVRTPALIEISEEDSIIQIRAQRLSTRIDGHA
jgi:hypothetical protein